MANLSWRIKAWAGPSPKKTSSRQRCAVYRKLLALEPNNLAALQNLGWALTEQKQFNDAIGVLRKAVALDAKDVPTHCNLGLALWGKGLHDEAIAAYRKPSNSTPNTFSPGRTSVSP